MTGALATVEAPTLNHRAPTAPGWWWRLNGSRVTTLCAFLNREVPGHEYLCYVAGFSFPSPRRAADLRGQWVGPYDTAAAVKEAAKIRPTGVTHNTLELK